MIKSKVGSRWSIVGLMLIAVMVNAAEEKHYFAVRGTQDRVDSVRVNAKMEYNPAPGASVPLADLDGRAVNKWLMCQARADRIRPELKIELNKLADHVRDTVCTHDEVYDWLRRQGLQIKEEVGDGKDVGK